MRMRPVAMIVMLACGLLAGCGSSAAALAARPAATSAGSSRCGGMVPLPAGVSVAGESPTVGETIVSEAQRVRRAVSTDGGKRWVTRGAALPVSAASAGNEQIAAISLARVWAAAGTSTLDRDRNRPFWLGGVIRRPVIQSRLVPVPGMGLWQTTDGTTWGQLGPAGPYA